MKDVYPRSTSEPLFRQMKFLNCDKKLDIFLVTLCEESLMGS